MMEQEKYLCIPNKNDFVGGIIGIFENFLESKGIKIPNDEKTGDCDEANIYGADYDAIADPIYEIINLYTKTNAQTKIVMDDGFALVADGYDDGDRKGVAVGIMASDGCWWQDLAVVLEDYQYAESGDLVVNHGKYDVYVFAREWDEDYSHKFIIDLHKEERE